jgi:hypothetical protein
MVFQMLLCGECYLTVHSEILKSTGLVGKEKEEQLKKFLKSTGLVGKEKEE